MIHELETNSFSGQVPSNRPGRPRPFVISGKTITHERTFPSVSKTVFSGQSVWPAFVLRRAGLLDPRSEELTRYHE